MYFAHAVGAGVLGAYFLFLAYYGTINLMTDGGFGGAAVKRISEGEEPDAYFSAFVVLRSVFVTVVIVALIAFRSYFVDLNSSETFIWLLVLLVISLLQGAVSSGITGCGKIGVCATTAFLDNVSRILFQVIAVFLGYDRRPCCGDACWNYSTAAFF
jgi:O-antigen/teichoic acid export membrane protein